MAHPGRSALLLLVLLACPAPAGAAELSLHVGDIERGPLALEGLRLTLTIDGGGAADARLSAERLRLGAAGLLRELVVVCGRGRVEAARIACEGGTLRATHETLGTLEGRVSFGYRPAEAAAELEVGPLALGGGAITARAGIAGGAWRIAADARDVALHALLALAGRAGDGDAGRVDVSVTARGTETGWRRAEARLTARALAHGGLTELQGVGGDARVTLERDRHGSIEFELDGRLEAGVAYVEPGLTVRGLRPGFVVEAPGEPLHLEARGRWAAREGALTLEGAYVHPGLGRLAGTLRARIADGFEPLHAQGTLEGTDAAALYATYLQPLLLGTRFDSLELAGALQGRIAWRPGRLEELALRFEDLHAYDRQGRFAVAGLQGDLAIHDGPSARGSRLAWEAAGIYRIDVGAGGVAFSSREGHLRLTEWTDLPVLGGRFRIDTLTLRQPGTADMALEIAGRLTPISLQEFTQAMGWPLLSGQMSGEIPGLTYSGGDLELAGTLGVQAFDGEVAIRNLRIEDLFGLVPRLRADIMLEGLDLERLTDAFSFGRIQGHLDGYVRDLQLEAWQPVYFEAAFATPEDDDAPHRISQRAVNNLGVLGGGTGGALSGGLLRFFEEYSYDRLGISCRLLNGSCELGGVKETEEGFYILTAGGLLPPWISVKGSGHSVPWNSLVRGLREITRREAVVR